MRVKSFNDMALKDMYETAKNAKGSSQELHFELFLIRFFQNEDYHVVKASEISQTSDVESVLFISRSPIAKPLLMSDSPIAFIVSDPTKKGNIKPYEIAERTNIYNFMTIDLQGTFIRTDGKGRIFDEENTSDRLNFSWFFG